MRYTQAIIDLAAIRGNLGLIKQKLAASGRLMAVVKANAYGHGLVRVAKAALESGCEQLAVAIPEEGIVLRAAGVAAPIAVLGLIPPEQAEECVINRLTVTVCEHGHLPPLSQAARKYGLPAGVLVKVNTGMNRIGANPREVPALIAAINQTPGISWAGLFTHFASAGGPDLSYADKQLDNFKQLLQTLTEGGLKPPLISSSASGAVFNLPHGHFDLARVGIAMYGLYPSDFIAQEHKLCPALQLVTRIAQIRAVAAGEPVGYEMNWREEENCLIAVLPVGYGDGYSRSLSNKASVLIGGRRYPAVGNICMDQMMVCLGQNSAAQPGDQAVLVGRQGGESITLEELALQANTINYELACNIAARVPRIYTD